jgi:hypothetical protein
MFISLGHNFSLIKLGFICLKQEIFVSQIASSIFKTKPHSSCRGRSAMKNQRKAACGRRSEFLTSPHWEVRAISYQDIRKQNLCSSRRARRAGGPVCTLAPRKSTFDCGLGWNRWLDRSTQRTQLPQNGTFLLARRATGRVTDAGKGAKRWFIAGR